MRSSNLQRSPYATLVLYIDIVHFNQIIMWTVYVCVWSSQQIGNAKVTIDRQSPTQYIVSIYYLNHCDFYASNSYSNTSSMNT